MNSTINEEFEEYARTVYPGVAAEELSQIKRAFFAGSLFILLRSLTVSHDLPVEAAAENMKKLFNEAHAQALQFIAEDNAEDARKN